MDAKIKETKPISDGLDKKAARLAMKNLFPFASLASFAVIILFQG
jgi:hypothetical protein